LKTNKRTCKGICKKFRVKKPATGSRYGAGQGRCQICDVWIDYRGCHMKDGSPALEYSLGWYCDCCNYRIRQKPRNKEYKEKLRAETLVEKTWGEKELVNKEQKEIIKKSTRIKNKIAGNTMSAKQEKSVSFQGNDEKNLIEECKKIINDYKKEKNHNLELKEDFVDVYHTFPSIKQVSEITKQPKNIVREMVKIPNRLPPKLKETYYELSTDPKLALNIAIHATDSYQWDGEKENHDAIHKLALDISDCFKKNPSFKDEFIERQKPKPRIIDESTKTARLRRLKEKYPYTPTEFNPKTDRTLFQYNKLVSTKNLKVAEYVLKWEYQNKKRISKQMASQIISNPSRFISKQIRRV